MRELLEKIGVDPTLEGNELYAALEKEKQKTLRRFNSAFGNPAKEREISLKLSLIEEAQGNLHIVPEKSDDILSTGIVTKENGFKLDDVELEFHDADNLEIQRDVINNDDLFAQAVEVYNNGDYNAAFELFQVLANNGDITSMFMLGISYGEGIGTESDFQNAMYWIQKSADLGYDRAMAQLGEIYRRGLYGAIIDYKKASDWLKKAVDEGNDDAMFSIGEMCYLGEGVKENKELGFRWFKKAADNGNIDALEYLGDIYLEGKFLPQDYAQAFNCYMTAAENGYPYGTFKTGIMFDNGMGMPASHKDAIEYYLKAADMGYPEAQLLAGNAYFKGDTVKMDYAKSFDYFTQAASQGEAVAQYGLGLMYEEGYGVNKNPFKAFEWYKRAAEQGDEMGQRALGLCYAEGIGVNRDFGEAVKWMRLSAAQKDEMAIEWLRSKKIASGSAVEAFYHYGSDANGDFRASGRLNNSLTGSGKLQYVSGKYEGQWYEGELVNGQINGRGTFHTSDGKRILGNFKNGLNGSVKVYDNSGNLLYEGGFNGNYHGQGVFHNSDGSVFQGEWNNGSVIRGKGTLRMRLNSGIVVKDIGNFEGTNLNGLGKRYILSGEDSGGYWEGTFNKGALNGLCVFHNKQGGKQETECVNGVFHGKMRVYSAVGVFCWETVYNNGKEVGPRKESYIYRKSRGRR